MEEVFTFQPRNSENTEFTLAITWAVSKLELYAVFIYRSLYDFSKASEQSLSMVKAFRNFTAHILTTSHIYFPHSSKFSFYYLQDLKSHLSQMAPYG